MTNLINRVREISKSIKDLEGLKATEDEAIGFRTRAEELSHLAAQIQAPAGRIGCSARMALPSQHRSSMPVN